MILYEVDSVAYMKGLMDKSVDFVLADPPYEEPELINASIEQAIRVSRGGAAYFMYGEDVAHLKIPPDRVGYWVKPISTKNTVKQYSRFVEVICFYQTKFVNKPLHWSNRSGVFTDALITEGERHPFAKPESLIERLLRNHCPERGSVLDPFSGSGTVHKVCTRLGYDCLALEIEKNGI